MKKFIILSSAAYLNGGAYVDAGTEVPVGKEKLEITEERAVDIEKGLRGEIYEVDAGDDDDAGESGEGAAAPAQGRRSRSR